MVTQSALFLSTPAQWARPRQGVAYWYCKPCVACGEPVTQMLRYAHWAPLQAYTAVDRPEGPIYPPLLCWQHTIRHAEAAVRDQNPRAFPGWLPVRLDWSRRVPGVPVGMLGDPLTVYLAPNPDDAYRRELAAFNWLEKERRAAATVAAIAGGSTP